MSQFDMLADEELYAVCQQMPTSDLVNLAQTNYRLNSICNEIIIDRELQKIVPEAMKKVQFKQYWDKPGESVILDTHAFGGIILDFNVKHQILESDCYGFTGLLFQAASGNIDMKFHITKTEENLKTLFTFLLRKGFKRSL